MLEDRLVFAGEGEELREQNHFSATEEQITDGELAKSR